MCDLLFDQEVHQYLARCWGLHDSQRRLTTFDVRWCEVEMLPYAKEYSWWPHGKPRKKRTAADDIYDMIPEADSSDGDGSSDPPDDGDGKPYVASDPDDHTG